MKKLETDGQVAPSQQTGRGPGLRRGMNWRKLVWSVPLGWQLSILYTLLLVITLSLVGSLVYSQQESFWVQDTANRLEQEAGRIAALPPPPSRSEEGQPSPGAHPDQQGPGQYGSPTTSEVQSRVIGNLVRGLSGHGVVAAVLDSQGNAITSTLELQGDTPPIIDHVTSQQATSVLQSNQPVQWIVKRADDNRYVDVLMAVTAVASGAPAGPGAGQRQQSQPITLLVEQSASLAAVDAALERLRTYLLLGVLGGTLVGVVLVLVFTRSVLRPLDQVVDTAEAIASGDLQRRLQLPAGKSEVARLGKAFDYMVSRLVATLEAQRRFIADASHELRTPLTSLNGLAEILVIGAHGNDPGVIEQSAGAMRGELSRLSRLVNDLLTLSRLNTADSDAAPQVRRTRMDICATMEAVTDQMTGLAEARGVRLIQQCTEPLWIMGDAGQIKQVFLNLVDNALRYTSTDGEIRITGTEDRGPIPESRTSISDLRSPVPGPSSWARIEVRDTGAGIAAQDLPHIFERFYRGDASRSRATGSSGLGLAIVQGIVEAHGGSIEVKSNLGAGTCFTIRLPLAQAVIHPDAAAEEAVAQPSAR